MKIGASSFVMTTPANEKASKTWHHLQSCQTSILDFRVNFTWLIGVLIVISRHKPTQSKLLSYNQHRENNLKGKIQVEAKLVSSFFLLYFISLSFHFTDFFPDILAKGGTILKTYQFNKNHGILIYSRTRIKQHRIKRSSSIKRSVVRLQSFYSAITVIFIHTERSRLLSGGKRFCESLNGLFYCI